MERKSYCVRNVPWHARGAGMSPPSPAAGTARQCRLFQWVVTRGVRSMTDAPKLEPRRGMPSPKLSHDEFRRRYRLQFVDPAFDRIRSHLDAAAEIAWDAYADGRKAPITSHAGPGFHDPQYELAQDWLDARNAIQQAETRYRDQALPRRILLINCSPRSEHTCPGEMSKSWRLIQIAKSEIERRHACDIEILDLSRVTSEYGRHIHPCKACF